MRALLAGLVALLCFSVALQAQQTSGTSEANAQAQSIYEQTDAPTPTATPDTSQISSQPTQNGVAQNTAQKSNEAPKQFTVPAGTQVLLRLQAPINTKMAQAGSGVYLQTIFPITSGNTVVIPVGSFVQGTIDKVVRPGHIKGRAQVQMHFTTLILPTGYTMSLPVVLDDVPGDGDVHKKSEEGTLERNGQVGRDIGAVATGAGVGTLSTAGTLNAKAIGIGAGAGAAAGLLYTLFSRGDDIRIEAGTQIEMVLQRPLVLEERKVEEANAHPTQLVPVDTVRVLEKEKHTGIAPVPCG